MTNTDGKFLKLDEDVFFDAKIRKLINEPKGFEAFGIYISLLIISRRYQKYEYEIPYDDLPSIAEWDMHIEADRLEEVIEQCVKCELFEATSEFFWSERRKNDLLSQDEKLSAKKRGALITNTKKKCNAAGVDPNITQELIEHINNGKITHI